MTATELLSLLRLYPKARAMLDCRVDGNHVNHFHHILYTPSDTELLPVFLYALLGHAMVECDRRGIQISTHTFSSTGPFHPAPHSVPSTIKRGTWTKYAWGERSFDTRLEACLAALEQA